jgi:hypothetical protein
VTYNRLITRKHQLEEAKTEKMEKQKKVTSLD